MRSRVAARLLIAGVAALFLAAAADAGRGDRFRPGHSPGVSRPAPAVQPNPSASGGTTHRPASPPAGDSAVAPFDWGLPFEWRGGYVGPSLGDYDGYPYSLIRLTAVAAGEAPPAAPPTASEPPKQATAAKAQASAVDLQVSPPTALVFLNGVLIGSVDEFGGAPESLYLDPGEYTLEFRGPGYRPKALHLKVSGEPIVVSLALEADPNGAGEKTPPSPGLPYGRHFGPDFGSATASSETPAGVHGPAT